MLLKQGLSIQLRLWEILFAAQKGNHIPQVFNGHTLQFRNHTCLQFIGDRQDKLAPAAGAEPSEPLATRLSQIVGFPLGKVPRQIDSPLIALPDSGPSLQVARLQSVPSKPAPTFLSCAGARLTTIFLGGRANPQLLNAARMRSRLSRIVLSGRPTMLKALSPIATSTSTVIGWAQCQEL